jgi:hypothetical protein
VYRSENEAFTPGPDDLVHATAETGWYDDVADGWRYHYKITAADRAGNESPPAAPGSATGSGGEAVPRVFAILPNAPNPFQTTTTIAIDVPSAADVRVDVYNVMGQHVRTLLDRRVGPGRELVRWDGRGESGRPVPSGVYFCRMTGPGVQLTQKMMKLR